jgi:hypothetical protein
LACERSAPSAARPQPTASPTTLPHAPVAPEPAAGPSNPVTAAEFKNEIRQRGSLTFRSWNGKWIGMDGDTDLTFLPGGAVRMIEYGFSVTQYPGSYTVTPAGDVTVKFPKFGHPWPLMTVRRDNVSLLLLPTEGKDLFVMGNRGGATIMAGQGSYWPFRPISVAEERELRARFSDEH